MKRILAFLALAVFSLSLYAQDCTPPPKRDPVPQSEIEKFIDLLLNGEGDGKGSAKEFFDELDKKYNLSEGLIKAKVGDQEVYMQPKEFFSELMAKRKDESEPKDAWFKGDGRHDKDEIIIHPDGKVQVIFNEDTKRSKDGVNWIIHLFKSKLNDNPKEGEREDECGSGGLEIKYEPLPVKVKEPQKIADVYVGGQGAVQLKVTDYLERWCLDGYKFKITVTNPEVMSAPSEVTSNSTGDALVVIKGLKEGQSKLKLSIDLTDSETGDVLKFEQEIAIDVLPAEEWSYSMHIYDCMLEPAQEYDLTGEFKVIQTFNEDERLVHWHVSEFSDAKKSGGASYPVIGGFMDELNRDKGIVMGIDIEGLKNRTAKAKKDMNKTERQLKKDAMRFAMSLLRNQLETFTYEGSDNPISCVIAPMKEGTQSFEFGNVELLGISGMDMSFTPGGAPPEMPKMSEEEYKQKMQEGMNNYLESGKVVVIPDFTKMMFVSMGNIFLTMDVAELKVLGGADPYQAAKDMINVRGTLTFTRNK